MDCFCVTEKYAARTVDGRYYVAPLGSNDIVYCDCDKCQKITVIASINGEQIYKRVHTGYASHKSMRWAAAQSAKLFRKNFKVTIHHD